jgi:hypothetical protein
MIRLMPATLIRHARVGQRARTVRRPLPKGVGRPPPARSNWKAFFKAHPPVLMDGPANLSLREGFAS